MNTEVEQTVKAHEYLARAEGPWSIPHCKQMTTKAPVKGLGGGANTGYTYLALPLQALVEQLQAHDYLLPKQSQTTKVRPYLAPMEGP